MSDESTSPTRKVGGTETGTRRKRESNEREETGKVFDIVGIIEIVGCDDVFR
jgi:hypothetical protein